LLERLPRSHGVDPQAYLKDVIDACPAPGLDGLLRAN
jgi:hypothetical protein